MESKFSLESRARVAEYNKQWEASGENFKRAYTVLQNFYGPVGFPGPEPGSVLWAAFIMNSYVKKAGLVP